MDENLKSKDSEESDDEQQEERKLHTRKSVAENSPDTERHPVVRPTFSTKLEPGLTLETPVPVLVDGKPAAKLSPTVDDDEHEVVAATQQDTTSNGEDGAEISQAIDIEENENNLTQTILQNQGVASNDPPANRVGRCQVTPGAFAVAGIDGDGEKSFHNWDSDIASDTNEEEDPVPLVTAEMVSGDEDRSVLLRRIEELEAQQNQPTVRAEPLDMRKLKRRAIIGISLIVVVAIGVGIAVGILLPAARARAAAASRSIVPSAAPSMASMAPS